MFGRRGGLVMGMLVILGVSALGGLTGVPPLSAHTGRLVVAFAQRTFRGEHAPPRPGGGYLYANSSTTARFTRASVARNRVPRRGRQNGGRLRSQRLSATAGGASPSRRLHPLGGYLATPLDRGFSRSGRLTHNRVKLTHVVVTAARPGMPVMGLLAKGNALAPGAGEYGVPKNLRLKVAEGLGPGWCLAYGGYPLGPSIDGVYACGPSLGESNPFDTDGFQCVELSARFMWDVYRKVIRKVPDGADLVRLGHKQLHIPVGTPGPNRLPAPGDILSLSGATADPAGHTAVVAAVNVDASGNGTIQILEENGSLSGWDKLDVSHWRETFGDPQYDAGQYYYTNVSWLKLAPVPRLPRQRCHRSPCNSLSSLSVLTRRRRMPLTTAIRSLAWSMGEPRITHRLTR